MSLNNLRLKSDFGYYVEQRLHIPFQDLKYIITVHHEKCISTVMDNKFCVIKGYRGWGKSELISFCYTLWRAEMWNESAIILSANEDLAFQKLDMIRSSVEFDNDTLGYMSGKGMDGITWNRGEIWLIDRNTKIYGSDGRISYKIKAKIYAKGLFSTFRGIHVHNIIGDDIVVEDNSLTHELREQTRKRFLAAAMGMRLSGGRSHVVVVGTPQHAEDLLEEISSSKDSMWAKVQIPALNTYGMPTCPELHDMEWIQEQRNIVGEAIFAQEYLLQPISLENDFFGTEMLDKSRHENLCMVLDYKKKQDEQVYLGVDFAVIEDKKHAEKTDSDYFAIVAIVYNTITGKRRILNMYRERGLSKMQQFNMLRIWDIRYEADKVGLETFAFLAWAKQDLSDELQKKIVDTSGKKGKMDVQTGIPSLQYEFEKEMFIVPYGDDLSKSIVNILFSELKNLGKSAHDDLSDALLRAETIVKLQMSITFKVDKEFRMYSPNRQREHSFERSAV